LVFTVSLLDVQH